MSERILVTGDSGFVGGSIRRGLIQSGYETIGISRHGENRLDIASSDFIDEVTSIASPCSVIIHAAASLEKDLFAREVTRVNCLGMQNILELNRIWKSYLIFISGITVIGKPIFLPITETHPITPLSAYHASKYFGELLVNIALEAGQKAVSLRLSSPVGKGMPQNRIMPFFVKAAMKDEPITIIGKGTRAQNYLDMRDLLVAIEKVLRIKPSGVFNIASGEHISNYDLAKLCIATCESKSVINFSGKSDPEEGQCWDISIEKALKIFNYTSACSTLDSLIAIKEGYENPDPE